MYLLDHDQRWTLQHQSKLAVRRNFERFLMARNPCQLRASLPLQASATVPRKTLYGAQKSRQRSWMLSKQFPNSVDERYALDRSRVAGTNLLQTTYTDERAKLDLVSRSHHTYKCSNTSDATIPSSWRWSPMEEKETLMSMPDYVQRSNSISLLDRSRPCRCNHNKHQGPI